MEWFWELKSSQIPLKIECENNLFFLRFVHENYHILAPLWDPKIESKIEKNTFGRVLDVLSSTDRLIMKFVPIFKLILDSIWGRF